MTADFALSTAAKKANEKIDTQDVQELFLILRRMIKFSVNLVSGTFFQFLSFCSTFLSRHCFRQITSNQHQNKCCQDEFIADVHLKNSKTFFFRELFGKKVMVV